MTSATTPSSTTSTPSTAQRIALISEAVAAFRARQGELEGAVLISDTPENRKRLAQCRSAIEAGEAQLRGLERHRALEEHDGLQRSVAEAQDAFSVAQRGFESLSQRHAELSAQLLALEDEAFKARVQRDNAAMALQRRRAALERFERDNGSALTTGRLTDGEPAVQPVDDPSVHDAPPEIANPDTRRPTTRAALAAGRI